VLNLLELNVSIGVGWNHFLNCHTNVANISVLDSISKQTEEYLVDSLWITEELLGNVLVNHKRKVDAFELWLDAHGINKSF
jgi:hypothetical protein